MADEKERAETIRATAKQLSRENISFRRELRYLRDAETRARSLSYDVDGLRYSLKMSKAGKEKLKARVATLRAAGATSSKLAFDEAAQLRTVLRRSRRQKTAIRRLRKENARLRKAVEGSRCRIETLETQLAKLRASGSVMSKRLYGKQERAAEEAGHGAQSRPATRRARPRPHPEAPGLRSAPKRSSRRRKSAPARGADSHMRQTAPRNPPSSRSRSRPTSA